MKDSTIAPYIEKHQRVILEKTTKSQTERQPRLRSPIFSMPDFDEWEDMHSVSFQEMKGGQNEGIKMSVAYPGLSQNLGMSANKCVTHEHAKVFCFLKQEVSKNVLSEAYEKISSNENDLIVCTDKILAMSSELFFLARGIDELIASINDGFDDFVLRAELLGGTVLADDWDRNRVSSIAKRNVEKGRLIVNQGSDFFS